MINTYPRSYYEARKAFREAALRVGAKIQDHVVLAGQQRLDDLSIDVAVIGSANPEWSVVVSTGLHGIEGFFGSAVQIAYLQDLIDRKSLDKRNGELVFLHSLNPFGFAMLRRVNEENVDLNRNFLLPSRSYRGAPDAYAKLNDFLNPQAPPRRVDFYLAKVLWKIGRVGLPALKQAIAGGQYKFPKGIFFGGHAPSRSAQIVQSNMLRWIRGRHVVHLDFHTGLGKYSTYKLLVTVPLGAEMQLQYRKLFGSQSRVRSRLPGAGFAQR
jgi:hypothetical protein